MGVVRIDRRFRGPPESGNGGYVCGVAAGALGGCDCSVTLRRPPPLETPLDLRRQGDGAALSYGEEVVATVEAEDLAIDAPAAPGPAAAEAAQARFTGFRGHVFPACFVCGPDRAAGDGLRIFPGALEDGSGRVAALWSPTTDLAGEDGAIRPEILWAALDCPGYFAVQEQAGLALLGRLSASLRRAPTVDQPLIVTGWSMGSEGRKHRAGTALHTLGGELIAVAAATWVTLRT